MKTCRWISLHVCVLSREITMIDKPFTTQLLCTITGYYHPFTLFFHSGCSLMPTFMPSIEKKGNAPQRHMWALGICLSIARWGSRGEARVFIGRRVGRVFASLAQFISLAHAGCKVAHSFAFGLPSPF